MASGILLGTAWATRLIESEAQPEAAVAYHTDFLFELCRRIGFSSSEIVHMPGGAQHQPILLCRK